MFHSDEVDQTRSGGGGDDSDDDAAWYKKEVRVAGCCCSRCAAALPCSPVTSLHRVGWLQVGEEPDPGLFESKAQRSKRKQAAARGSDDEDDFDGAEEVRPSLMPHLCLSWSELVVRGAG